MMKMFTLTGLLFLGISCSYAQTSNEDNVSCDEITLDIDQTRKSTTVKGTVTAKIDQEDAEKAVAIVYLRYKNSTLTQQQQANMNKEGEIWSGDFISLRKHKGLESAVIKVYTFTSDGEARTCLIGEEQPTEMAELTLK